MGNETIINVKNVSFKYDTTGFVLNNICFDINKNEIFTILGPSGCGKSTLLSLIGKHLNPTKGDIKFHNSIITKGNTRNIKTIFQEDILFPHLSVQENILIGLSSKKEQIENKFDSLNVIAGYLEIIDILNKKPNELSGGQKKRVSIARALITKPEIILLDEPLSSLDYNLRNKLKFKLKEIQQDYKLTFIYVTHNQEEALSISDRIAILDKKGFLNQIGSPSEIYNAPKNAFVAEFIGIDNTIIAQEILELIESDGVVLNGYKVLVHSENILLNKPPNEHLALKGMVAKNEFLGNSFKIDCILNNGQRLTVRTRTALKENNEVELYIPINKLIRVEVKE